MPSTRAYFIPGQGYINEVRGNAYFIPGWGYINETVSLGTNINCDSPIPFEISASFNAGILTSEFLASQFVLTNLISEISSSVRNDQSVPNELLAVQRRDQGIPIEWVNQQSTLSPVLLEILASVRRDHTLPTETAASWRSDSHLNTELIANFKRDTPLMTELLSGVTNNATRINLEALVVSLTAASMPFEILGIVTLNSLASVQLEFSTGVRVNLPLCEEFLSGVNHNEQLATEFLAVLASLCNTPFEFVSTIVLRGIVNLSDKLTFLATTRDQLVVNTPVTDQAVNSSGTSDIAVANAPVSDKPINTATASDEI